MADAAASLASHTSIFAGLVKVPWNAHNFVSSIQHRVGYHVWAAAIVVSSEAHFC